MTDNDTLDRVRAHIDAGELQEALDLCLPLANDGDVEALYLLAVVSHHGGLHEQAMNLYRESAKLLGGRADVLYNFGVFLREQDEIEGAIEAWMQASKNNPLHWQASFNLGLALSETGRDREAVKAYEQCLKAAPGNVDASFNLGNACFRLGAWSEARAAFDQVLAINPDHGGALSNLGLTLMRCGEDAEAVATCRKAVERAPDDVVAHANLGHALLAAGDWLSGFDELKWRWKVQTPPQGLDGISMWQGEDLNGGHLVLFGEQGHGDVLQYVRFAEMARERANAGRVSIMCHAPLKDIVARVRGVDQVFALDDDVEQVDACVPLMDLPAYLWVPDSVVMPVAPYIAAPEPRALGGDGLRVGLVWRGNPEHANDANRSCSLGALAPVFDVAGTQFFALQWGGLTDGELADIEGRDNVTDLSDAFDGFAEAAEIIAGLDVLISVDTAMAHLSGAMGRETWVLLPKVSDWRWRGPEGFSPWYPRANLFQQSHDDWSAVADMLSARLKSLAAQ
ncbi:tetratricopeptide repeat protein [Pseudomonadota bacterium]